jgi:hypothetical protein
VIIQPPSADEKVLYCHHLQDDVPDTVYGYEAFGALDRVWTLMAEHSQNRQRELPYPRASQHPLAFVADLKKNVYSPLKAE